MKYDGDPTAWAIKPKEISCHNNETWYHTMGKVHPVDSNVISQGNWGHRYFNLHSIHVPVDYFSTHQELGKNKVNHFIQNGSHILRLSVHTIQHTPKYFWSYSPSQLTFSHNVLTWFSCSCWHCMSCSIHWSSSFNDALSSIVIIQTCNQVQTALSNVSSMQQGGLTGQLSIENKEYQNIAWNDT